MNTVLSPFTTVKTNQQSRMEGLLLGLGNPLLDVSATVPLEFLEKYNMKPNNAILAEDIHKNLCEELTKFDVQYIAGGSVQNTFRVAQWLLEKPNITTFFGCVGDDDRAKTLNKIALSAGVNVKYQINPNYPTGTCAVLITGTNRSLCADLGAANHFSIDHLKNNDNWKLVEKAKYYYVSGFFLTVSVESILEVAKHALQCDKVFITNLNAVFISQVYKSQLLSIMPYVDYLFGNEEEAEALANELNYDTKCLKEIALKLCELPKENSSRRRTVIITQGTQPVILAQDGKITEFPVISLPKEKIVDTNGAGDAFVGGFLAQFIQERPIDVCIRSAIYTASEIIQQNGCTYKGKHQFRG